MSKRQLGLTTLGLILVIVLVLFILGTFGGGYAGWYPHTAGFGLGTVLIIVLVVLLATGRI